MRNLRKFLAMLVVVALMATILAPSAVAATSHDAEAKALYDIGLFKGVSPDKYDPALDQALNREQGVALILRLIGKEAEALNMSEADAQAALAGYTDKGEVESWAVKYMGFAVKNKIVLGTSTTTLSPLAPLSGKQLATMILRNVGFPTSTPEEFESSCAKLESIGATGATQYANQDVLLRDHAVAVMYSSLSAKPNGVDKTVIELLIATGVVDGQKAVEAGIITPTATPTATVTPTPTVGALEISAVSAVAAKGIKVEFNQAVDDTKANFSVKKGTVTATVASKEFSEDKKSVVLTMASKLTEGTYTVTVSGLTTEPLSKSFDAVNETVGKIEILSDVAPLKGSSNPDNLKIRVPYKVTNQYGEDITKVTSLTMTSTKGTVSVLTTGVLEVTATTAFVVDEKVTISLVHAASAVSTVKTLSVGNPSKVAEVTIGDLYNTDGKILNEDTVIGTDDFYLPVQAKDQYGMPVTNTTSLNSDIIVNNSNPTIFTVGSFTTTTINGETVTVLPISDVLKVGEATITLISNTTGKSSSKTVKVAESVRAYNVTLEQPDLVAANETIYVPATVTDKDGNEIKDVTILNDSVKGVQVTVSGTDTSTGSFQKVNGQIVINAGVKDSAGTAVVVALTRTNFKSASLTVTVQEEAVPTVITGVQSTFPLALLVSAGAQSIAKENLVIEDQYGRVMTDSSVGTWLHDADGSAIKFSSDTETVATVGATISDSDDSVVLTPVAKGTAKLTIMLANSSGNITSSALEVTVRVTDGTDYVSYQVDNIGTIYASADVGAYSKTVKVYGVLSNGSKIALTHGTDFQVFSTNSALNADVSADGIIDTDLSGEVPSDKWEISVPLTVTINATGRTFEQQVTISVREPEVQQLVVLDNGEYAKIVAGAKTLAQAETVTSLAFAGSSKFDWASIDSLADVVAIDQYNVPLLVTNTTNAFADGTALVRSLRFANASNTSIIYRNNGLKTAYVTYCPANTDYEAVVTVGGKSVTLSVNQEAEFLGFTITLPAAVEHNGITATLTNVTGSPKPAGTSMTLRITLSGTATAAGTHTVGLAIAGVDVTAPGDLDVHVDANDEPDNTFDFTFTMPANNILAANITLTHTFVAD